MHSALKCYKKDTEQTFTQQCPHSYLLWGLLILTRDPTDTAKLRTIVGYPFRSSYWRQKESKKNTHTLTRIFCLLITFSKTSSGKKKQATEFSVCRCFNSKIAENLTIKTTSLKEVIFLQDIYDSSPAIPSLHSFSEVIKPSFAYPWCWFIRLCKKSSSASPISKFGHYLKTWLWQMLTKIDINFDQ